MARKNKKLDDIVSSPNIGNVYSSNNTLELATSIQDVEILSMAEIQKEKQELEKKRTAILLALDKKRIEQSKKIMDNMDYVLNQMTGYYDESGNLIATSALDMKLYSEAYKNLLNCYNLITRLDSVDTSGRAGRISLEIKYEVT